MQRMRNGNIAWAALAMVLAAIGVTGSIGCQSPRVGETHGRPVRITSPELSRGQQVFMTHCHQCHPGGAAGLAPPLNDKPLPAFLIKFQVRRGLGAMPAFSQQQISDPDLDALAEFVVRMHHADKARSAPPATRP